MWLHEHYISVSYDIRTDILLYLLKYIRAITIECHIHKNVIHFNSVNNRSNIFYIYVRVRFRQC